MDQVFIGFICPFGFYFAPNGWALCQGQIMSIANNEALFALIGTTYGGDGQQTFALPDLQGRMPIGQGNGPGLTPRTIGEAAGSESVTLLQTQMPTHNHSLNVSSAQGTASNPSGNVLAAPVLPSQQNELVNTYVATPDATANPQAIGMAGGNQPHDNLMPFLTMNYCIALEGIFPSRN